MTAHDHSRLGHCPGCVCGCWHSVAIVSTTAAVWVTRAWLRPNWWKP